MADTITLRPATAGDESFFRALYASTREEELAPLGWTTGQRDAFLDLQYGARQAHYRREFPTATDSVVEAAGAPAGRFYVERGDNRIRVIDVAMAPGHRGRGIGTRLLSDLIVEASAAGKVVELHVEFNNPAQRLYRRLGFEVAEERPPYYRLERRPGGGQPNTTS